MGISIDPTEIKDVPCEICGVFYPEDEMHLEGLCWDCWDECINEPSE
tara:strand:+ start:379 stop:519 length:141 start_codon:yes stop_codon:yes gene_type:complete